MLSPLSYCASTSIDRPYSVMRPSMNAAEFSTSMRSVALVSLGSKDVHLPGCVSGYIVFPVVLIVFALI
jgi:hypothetical protein